MPTCIHYVTVLLEGLRELTKGTTVAGADALAYMYVTAFNESLTCTQMTGADAQMFIYIYVTAKLLH
jgi:hypothetical protein